MSGALVDAALDYARRGWPVLPLHGKIPRTEHGLKDASTDLDQIERWWLAWPYANVGLVTGVAFDVLDIDTRAAADAIDALRPADGLDPRVGPMVATGKGWHYYWRPTGHGNRTGIVDGADWRGRNGYVVAPPSAHASGRVYEWLDGPDMPIPAAEAWLVALVAHPRSAVGNATSAFADVGRNGGTASISGLVARVAVAPEGKRDAVLYWAAARVADDARAGKLRDVAGALDQLHLAAVRAGLSDGEVERTIRSATEGAR
jgi:hypothetical protein